MATAKKTASGALAIKHYLWFGLAAIALVGVIVLFALDKGDDARHLLMMLGAMAIPGSPLGGLARRERDGGEPPTYGGSARRGTADDPGPGWGAPTDRADRSALGMGARWALDVLGIAVVLGALGLVTSGCGGGRLETAVRSVSYGRVFLNLAATVEEEAIATMRDACAADEACLADVERTAEIVGDVHDLAVAALEGWESGVRAAVDVDAGEDVVAAVVAGGAGVADRLLAVAEIIVERLRLELPSAVRTILATVQALLRALAQPPGDAARVEVERWLLGLA